MSDEGLPCMLGRKRCGCAVAVVVVPQAGDPESWFREYAKMLREWQRSGLQEEQVTVGDVRNGTAVIARCPHKRKSTTQPVGKKQVVLPL